MRENYYFVELTSSLTGLLEQLDDYGFDYDFDALYPVPEGYIEIHVYYYPHEIRELENIFAPYV
jgi:hypothetical protein